MGKINLMDMFFDTFIAPMYVREDLSRPLYLDVLQNNIKIMIELLKFLYTVFITQRS